MGQRKKLRESCDAALRPLYAEGAAVCSELEPSAASAASASEHAPTAAVPQQMLPGPRFVWTVRVAAPCARRPVPSSAQSPSRQRHFQFPRSGRAAPPRSSPPLRLLGARVKLLTEAEAQAAQRPADQRTFVVRYAGG